MSAQPTAATARWVLDPPRSLARSRCCSSFPDRSGALPYIFDGREQVFQQIGAPLCGLFPFIVMFLVFPPSGSACRPGRAGAHDHRRSRPAGGSG
jgi:hypothetical protein